MRFKETNKQKAAYLRKILTYQVSLPFKTLFSARNLMLDAAWIIVMAVCKAEEYLVSALPPPQFFPIFTFVFYLFHCKFRSSVVTSVVDITCLPSLGITALMQLQFHSVFPVCFIPFIFGPINVIALWQHLLEDIQEGWSNSCTPEWMLPSQMHWYCIPARESRTARADLLPPSHSYPAQLCSWQRDVCLPCWPC